MNRTFVAVCGAIVMSAALLGAQDKASQDKTKTATSSGTASNTVTFTGCLNAGSTENSFYLTSARQKGAKTNDKSVKLVPGGKKVGLDRYLIQNVEVTGTIDPAEPPAADAATQQVRTLTVTKVKVVSESCG